MKKVTNEEVAEEIRYNYLESMGLINKLPSQKYLDEIDKELIKCKFDNTKEKAHQDNLILEEIKSTTAHDANKIIDDFITSLQERKPIEKTNIHELVKLFNLPTAKLRKFLNKQKIKSLSVYLYNVSRETLYISYDFMILKLIDNILSKELVSNNLADNFQILKKTIFTKMANFTYKKEKKEKESTYYCWFDRLTSAVAKKEIKPYLLSHIYFRILTYVSTSDFLYWKAMNSIIYLMENEDFKHNEDIYELKVKLENMINMDNIKELSSTISLQKNIITFFTKEKFSVNDITHLFSELNSVAFMSEKKKDACLNLFNYILYYAKRCNYMQHPEVRKSFLDNIFSLIQVTDSTDLKIKEIQFLLKVLNTHIFKEHTKSILNTLLQTMKMVNDGKTKLTRNNFYKYCQYLDIFLYSEDLPEFKNVVDFLSNNKCDRKKIVRYFKLYPTNVLITC